MKFILKIKIFSPLIACLILYFSQILYPQSENSNIKFVRYSTMMGLSSNSQNCISQDKEGFIWIGTGDGLNRFDGYTFKVYRKNPQDSMSLRSNIISCLLTDSKGTLWIGTYSGGLSRYNKGNDDFYSFPNLVNSNINALTEDKHHRLWIGSSAGLFIYSPESNKFREILPYTDKPFDPSDVNEFAVDNDTLWIAFSTGILSAVNTSTMVFKNYSMFEVSSKETANFNINSLVVDNDKIWISTWSKGIWIFNKNTGTCRPYKKEKSQYINFVFKDNKNRFWYSPEYKGLVLLNGEKKSIIKEDDFNRNSISSNLLSGIYQDMQNNLWITSKLGDLNYVELNNPFRNWYKKPNSQHELSSNLINTVMVDKKNRIWVGYEEGGIDILDVNNVKPKIHISGNQLTGLGPGPVMYIFESRDGTIWIGKYLDGLKQYNESSKTFSSYQHIDGNNSSIVGNDIRHISEDSKGNLWIAVHGVGVDMLNPKTGIFIHHKSDPGDPDHTILNNWTFTAFCDQNDNIWVCTVSGVSEIMANSKIIKQFTENNDVKYSLSNSLALVVFVDSKNYVWIGTADGLNRLNPKTGLIKKFLTKDGLPSNLIIDIIEDNNHDIWISTTNGLSKYSRKNGTFKNFSVQDGLTTDEFHKFASSKNKEGEMFFGGRDGLTCFFPDSIKLNRYRPPVYITAFKLFNKEVQTKNDNMKIGFYLPHQIIYCKEITLNHNQNEITLEFTALNYLNLAKNQYRYKLEGFDNYWSSPGFKREVTYTNLDPGEYTFRVMASNNDGIWNREGRSLKIIIEPPFWKTYWAYAFYFLFIVFLFYVFRKFTLHEAEIKRKLELEELEIQKLHEMDLLKMQFFANISHEFRTPLTLIKGPIEKLLRDVKDEFHQVQLNLVNRNANRLLRMINQLMDFRKIEVSKLDLNLTKNDIVLFIKEIVDTFKQDAVQRNINFTFNYTLTSLEIWFDADKLDKIIYNLLSNAFKFTRDKDSIEISLDFNNSGTENENFNPEFLQSEQKQIQQHSVKGSNVAVSSKVKTFKISVKDSGIGINKDAQKRIFDRFYQVNNNITSQGTGIGLSLTYELVKLHMGEIIVDSTPDIGSEFTVILPLWLDENDLPQLAGHKIQKPSNNNSNGKELKSEEENEEEQIRYEENQPQKKLPKILIIEDNADMRLFIRNEFEKNYRIIEAHDGIIGIKKAFEEIPDAIICDIMMPGKDGFEVCKILKNDAQTSHIPIVMLTAKSSEQHTIEGFESGADDYVAKPFSTAVLKARIKNLIDSRNLLRKKFISEPFASLSEISPSKTDEKLFQKAYSIVEKNLNNPDFDVNLFASEIGMSRTQLYRKIHAISGQPVKEFIRVIRLKKAAELLLTTDNNITEVAYTVGFNSLSYFTTSFTEYYGMNPTKYLDKYTR